MQAVQQHMTSLDSQLHSLATDLAQLTAKQTHGRDSAPEQPSAAESALKQRLRKVELTVAGEQNLGCAFLVSSCMMRGR